MALMKDLNKQMKIQAERIRLQSRGGRTHGSPTQYSVISKDHNQNAHVTKQKPPIQGRGSSSRGRDAPTTPSKIPVRKCVPGVSALKGKSVSGVQQTPMKNGGEGQKHVKFGETVSRPHDYTWHKDDRLQEIRIRYIARKYFHLWMFACFGRVGPYKTRAHYHKRLLRMVWREWHDMWWMNRREWRLQVRAQYHYRYCMTRKAWQSWVNYVERQRLVNARTTFATVHANTKLLQTTFAAWKQYTAYRDVKKKNFGSAYHIADTRRLARCWKQWRALVQGLEDAKDMQRHALQHWAHGLLQKTWVRWRARLASRGQMKKKYEMAVDFYNRNLLTRCLYQGLMPYILHHRDRQHDKGVARQFYLDRLVHSHFQHWHTLWFTRRSLALLGEQINVMAQRARLRRTWIHWQYFVYLQHIQAEKTAQATKHYQKQLMKQGLCAFHTAVRLRKLKNIRQQRAEELRYNLLLRRSWGTWLLRCEHKEELRLFVQSRRARNHYKGVLLCQAMRRWVSYTRWRRHRQAQYIKADAHFVARLLPTCLRRLQMFAQEARDKRFNQQQAELFRRECLLGFCFARWCHSYHTSMDVRMMQRMAIMHYDHNVAQRMLKFWKQRTRLQLQEHAKEDMAVEHHEAHLIDGCIRTWKAFTLESQQRRGKHYQAVRHHRQCMLRKGWIGWTKFVAYRRLKSSKVIKAVVYCRHQLLCQTLNAWKVYSSQPGLPIMQYILACLVQYNVGTGRAPSTIAVLLSCMLSTQTQTVIYHRGMQKVHTTAKEREKNHNMATLRWTLARWVENARLQSEASRNALLADNHHRICLLGKVILCWRQYAVLHARKQMRNTERLLQIKVHLDEGKCRRAFYAWRTFKDKALLHHLSERRAISHYRRIVLHQALHRWKLYRQLVIRKMLLMRQCVWLHNTRITAKYFLRWRAQHHAVLAEHGKTTVALWQWSLVLQQRVLNAWLQYVMQQKHKERRIAEALEMRRQRLLREGVGQWLRVALDTSERREKRAAKHHAQIAYRSYRTVRRCAHHWLQKTLANRHKRAHHCVLQPSIKHPWPQSQADSRIGTSSIDSRPRTPVLPQSSIAALAIAHGATLAVKERFDTLPAFREITAKHRPKPRRPDFLMESLQREGLWKSPQSHSESEMHPSPAEAVFNCHKSSTSDEDDNAAQESLPRKTPPPSPSSQPKYSPPSEMTDITDRSSEMDSLPPDLGASFGRDGSVDTHTRRDKDARKFETDDSASMGTILLPPSAFTAVKPVSYTARCLTSVHQKPVSIPYEITDSRPVVELQQLLTTDNDAPNPETHQTISTTANPGLSVPRQVIFTEPSDAMDYMSDAPASAASGQLRLLSPDAFGITKDKVDCLDFTEARFLASGKGDEESGLQQDEVYKEIVELKTQLVQYQEAKQRLGSLKEQYRHLKSWLQELQKVEGHSAEMQPADDEDAELVREEVVQMEMEIGELTLELDLGKPECTRILSRINALAVQIQ